MFTKWLMNNKSYSWRLIKKQYPNRWRLNNEWYSKNQLRPKLYLNPNPEIIHAKTPW